MTTFENLHWRALDVPSLTLLMLLQLKIAKEPGKVKKSLVLSIYPSSSSFHLQDSENRAREERPLRFYPL